MSAAPIPGALKVAEDTEINCVVERLKLPAPNELVKEEIEVQLVLLL